MEHNESNLLANIKILYVEDETEAREELYKYLKRRVGKIYAAENGARGMELYCEHKPDIVIADLYMPEMDGIELVRQIRKIDESCHIIITSAVSDVDIILKSVDLGINKYIIKPIDSVELLTALSEASYKLNRKKGNSELIEGERKKKLEDEIKKEFSAFLKTCTGKGPRDVTVFIHQNVIEINAYDALTIMEKNMIDNQKNHAIIEQNRKLFYSIKEEIICEMIYSILQMKTQIKRVEVNAEKGTNKIILNII